jgi:GntR family transcriptional regulator of arabinose operon
MFWHTKALSMAKKLKKYGPLYIQLADLIQDEIASGRHAVGGYLPSERALGDQFDVTRITVRGALKRLEEAGIVRREAGRGTQVVRAPNASLTIELFFVKWISPFADPILSGLCTGVATRARELDYVLTLTYIRDENSVNAFMENLELSSAAGMIVVGSWDWYKPIMGRIESLFPTVLVGTPLGSIRADVMEPDYEGAMALAVEHAKALGHRRLLLLAGAFRGEDRRDERNISSFQQAARRCGYSRKNAVVWNGHERRRKNAQSSGYGFFVPEDLFDEISPPLMVIATAPSFAVNFLSRAKEKGLRVPDDVAIISTQNSQKLEQTDPAISSVDLLGEAAGKRAVERLKMRLESPALPRRMERTPIRLIPRGSCGEEQVESTAEEREQ